MSTGLRSILFVLASTTLATAALAGPSRTGRPVCDALVAHEPRVLRDGLLEMSAPVLGKAPRFLFGYAPGSQFFGQRLVTIPAQQNQRDIQQKSIA